MTALMKAVEGGFDDVAQSLFDTGAVLDQVDNQGRTAAIEGGFELGDLILLLGFGGDSNAENARYRKFEYVY